MMTASVVGIGMAGNSLNSSPAISSSRSSSLHDPSVVAPSSSSSDSNYYPEGQSPYSKDGENRMTFTHPELSSLSSSSGKQQLALSSSQGREASPAPSYSGDCTDEKDIALTQLRELDLAIEVRKVTRVDGRKTRWIEYRKKKGIIENPFVKEENEYFDSISEKSDKNSRGKKTADEKLSLDINENSSPIKIKSEINDIEPKLVKSKTVVAVNNNNKVRNNNISDTSMKVDTSVVVASPSGTNNVLETMKHQFLQGTVNLPEATTNGVKEKKTIRKIKIIDRSSPDTENVKRKPGRPRKPNSFKQASISSTPNIKVELPSPVDSLSLDVPTLFDPNELDSVNTVKKIEIPSGTFAQSPTDFYPKRSFHTKGLREVRKSESGSESGTSSPEKNGTPTNTCPSTPLPVSPVLHSLAGELENSVSIKCPLITAAAKALSAEKKKANCKFSTQKKKQFRKLSKKKDSVNLISRSKSEGNLSIKKIKKKSLSLISGLQSNKEKNLVSNEKIFIAKKRGRGRPKSNEENGAKFKGENVAKFKGKKTSNVIVDVHNTMNGEPQSVIPSKHVLPRKKISVPKRKTNSVQIATSNAVIESIVPKISDTPPLSESSDKRLNPSSAFYSVFNDSLDNAYSTKVESCSILDEKLEEIENNPMHLKVNSPKGSQHFESVQSKVNADSNANNNNIHMVWSDQSDDCSGKPALKTSKSNYRLIAMMPQGLKSPGTIIVSTAEAIKKSTQDRKQRLHSELPKNSIGHEKNQMMNIEAISEAQEPNRNFNTSQHILNSGKTIGTATNSVDKKPSRLNIFTKNSSKQDIANKDNFKLSIVNNTNSKVDVVNNGSSKSGIDTNDFTTNNGSSKLSTINNVSVKQGFGNNSNCKISIDDNETFIPGIVTNDFSKQIIFNSDRSKEGAFSSDPSKQLSVNSDLTNQDVYNNLSVLGIDKNDHSKLSVSNNDLSKPGIFSKDSSKLIAVNNKTTSKLGIVNKDTSKLIIGKKNPKLDIVTSKDASKLFNVSKDASKSDIINKGIKPTPGKIIKRSINAVIDKLQSPVIKKISDLSPSDDINKEKLGSVNPHQKNIPNLKLDRKCIEKSAVKPKEKMPRFLKQLFQDEGVQNMLRSVNEEIPTAMNGYSHSDLGPHKLRPKRANENLASESPEPDESLGLPCAKRKKRGTEVDNLFLDEGTLNLLTSLDSGSRRPLATDDTSSDCSQTSSSKSIKLSRQTLNLPENFEGEIRKRKLSGSSTSSIASDAKKLKIESNKNKSEPSIILKPIQGKMQTDEQAKKKTGKNPVNITLQQKKISIEVLLKKQLFRLGIESNNLSVPQMKEIIEKTRNSPHQINLVTPPLKIKVPTIESGKQAQKTPDIFPKAPKHLSVAGSSRIMQNTIYYSGQKKYSHQQQKNSQPMMSLMRPLNNSDSIQSKGKSRPFQEGIRQSQRASVRQSDSNHHYRDISVRKYNYFMQIILTPSTTKMKNALNTRVLKELCEALEAVKSDDTVRMVLITGTGSTFCQGIDLTALLHPNIEIRKKNAESLTKGIKEFLRALVQFPKILVAGVNGDAMGLGVTMLPLFDSVIASDKAEFFLPYSRLGQVPEGGATYTFPYNYGKLPSLNLFGGNKLTAKQALQMGLVSESLWPNTFLQELIPKVGMKASIPTQGLEATKALMNHHLVTKLELSLESENRLLLQHWTTSSFYNSCKRFLDTHDIPFQKPVSLPPY